MDEDDKKIRISQITSPADPGEDFQTVRVLQWETFPREQLCNNNVRGRGYDAAWSTLIGLGMSYPLCHKEPA